MHTPCPHPCTRTMAPMVGRDVPGTPRTRGRHRGRGPPRTSAPTIMPCPYPRTMHTMSTHHARTPCPTSCPHPRTMAPMVGRDVPGAPRTRGRHRGRHVYAGRRPPQLRFRFRRHAFPLLAAAQSSRRGRRDEMRFHCVIISKAIILKMPRLRVRQVKPGRNDRNEMRFQRVIISIESRILLESRVAPRGVMRSAITALPRTVLAASGAARSRKIGIRVVRQKAVHACARRSRMAASTFAKSVGSFATGTVENARRMRPERTIVPVEYFSISWRRTRSASTPTGFTHMK